jgi:hypothetical protein
MRISRLLGITRIRTSRELFVWDIFKWRPGAANLSVAVLADYLNYNLTFRDHLLLYVEAGLAGVGSRLLLRQVGREAGSP